MMTVHQNVSHCEQYMTVLTFGKWGGGTTGTKHQVSMGQVGVASLVLSKDSFTMLIGINKRHPGKNTVF